MKWDIPINTLVDIDLWILFSAIDLIDKLYSLSSDMREIFFYNIQYNLLGPKALSICHMRTCQWKNMQHAVN